MPPLPKTAHLPGVNTTTEGIQTYSGDLCTIEFANAHVQYAGSLVPAARAWIGTLVVLRWKDAGLGRMAELLGMFSQEGRLNTFGPEDVTPV